MFVVLGSLVAGFSEDLVDTLWLVELIAEQRDPTPWSVSDKAKWVLIWRSETPKPNFWYAYCHLISRLESGLVSGSFLRRFYNKCQVSACPAATLTNSWRTRTRLLISESSKTLILYFLLLFLFLILPLGDFSPLLLTQNLPFFSKKPHCFHTWHPLKYLKTPCLSPEYYMYRKW